jgi:diguanylate cyclase (GGDEF)-like protein
MFVICSLSVSVLAVEQQEVENFILLSKVETYDCPNEKYTPQLDGYLAEPQLSENLRVRLQVQKAQALICVGQYAEAKALLVNLVNNDQVDKDSQEYASAIYQIGFIYDVEEDYRRCDYYHQAQQLAKDRFNDIYLSAQLGQITMCDVNSEDNSIKLGRLYALLEEFSASGDKAAIAHIHNNIGLLYGSIGQHVLAAEQYEKSYQMGLGVYEKNNLLSTLISAITSHLASGHFEDAKDDIEEFKLTNKEVNTPLSNVWLHFAESSYYYRTGNFDELKNSLLRWQVFLPEVSNYQLLGLYRWHSAAMCLHDQDESCLRTFLRQEENEKPEYKALISRNKDYLRLLVDIQLFLGDISAAQASFTQFADTMLEKAMRQQASAKVLGVANMHAKILSLESSLAAERDVKLRYFGGFGLFILILFIIIIWSIKRYLLKQSSLDPLTGLLNENSAVQMIKQIAKPSENKINALALFNLDNFKDINAVHGHKSADLALCYAANSLQQITRENDIVGRFETEKFIVCLADVDEKVAGELFTRVNQALQQSCFNSEYGEEIKVKVSMPVCFSADRFDDIDEMLGNIRDNYGRRQKA